METKQDLEAVLRRVCDKLKTSCTSIKGTEFEKEVAKVLEAESGGSWIIKHLGGKNFPDILVMGQPNSIQQAIFGVEVKSSKKRGNSKVPGGSIMEGTSRAPFEKVIAFFGNLEEKWFKFADYQDCVSSIKITHSPRYMLDFSLAKGKDFFSRHKIEYTAPVKNKDIFSTYKKYVIMDMKEKGENFWWNKRGDGDIESLVTNLGELDKLTREDIIAEMYFQFPGIFTSSTNNRKFYAPSKWLLKKFGVVCHNLRDQISVAPNDKFKRKVIAELGKSMVNANGCSNFVFHIIKWTPKILTAEGTDFKNWTRKILASLVENNDQAVNLKTLEYFFGLPEEKMRSLARHG